MAFEVHVVRTKDNSGGLLGTAEVADSIKDVFEKVSEGSGQIVAQQLLTVCLGAYRQFAPGVTQDALFLVAEMPTPPPIAGGGSGGTEM